MERLRACWTNRNNVKALVSSKMVRTGLEKISQFAAALPVTGMEPLHDRGSDQQQARIVSQEESRLERAAHEGGVKTLPAGPLLKRPAKPLIEARGARRVEEDPRKAARPRLLLDRPH